MAGRGLGTLTLDLVARTGGFTDPLDKAGRDLDKRAKAMQKTASAFGKAIGVSLVAAASAFGYAIKAAIDQADELNDASKKIGIPTDVLSQLQYAAKLSGIASEELQSGLVKMVKFQAAAAQGAKENVRVFSALGIAIKDSGGNLRDSKTLFEDFADVFAELKDGPEKTALALKVFGKAGAELVPLLDEGKAGIQGMADELDRLGGTVAPETARAADEFNDQIEALKTQVGGLALSVAADLLPDLIDLVKAFRDTTGTGEDLKDTAHSIAQGFRDIAGAVGGGIDVLQAFGNAYVGVAAKMQEWQAKSPLGRLLGLDGKTPSDVSAFAFADMRRNLSEAANSWNGSSVGKDPRIADWDTPAGRVPRGRDLGGLFSPEQKGAKAAKKSIDEVAEAVKRMNAQMDETIALYNQTGEAAKIRYQIEFGELAKASQAEKDALLLKAQKLDQLAAEKQAREEAIRLEEQEAKAAKEHAQDIKDLLDDLAFETELTKLSNEEKERALILRRSLAGATEEEAKQITAAVDNMLAAQKHAGELSGAMDDFRASFSDSVTDVLTGAKSISDAFKSLADTIVAQIARIIANQLTESLFGAPGSTSGGSQGGWLSSLFSIFLPHHATGTQFAPGGPSVVGEHGPEIVNLPRGSQVIPNGKFGGHSVTVNINGGSNPRETALQTAREVRRVLAFSGRS